MKMSQLERTIKQLETIAFDFELFKSASANFTAKKTKN